MSRQSERREREWQAITDNIKEIKTFYDSLTFNPIHPSDELAASLFKICTILAYNLGKLHCDVNHIDSKMINDIANLCAAWVIFKETHDMSKIICCSDSRRLISALETLEMEVHNHEQGQKQTAFSKTKN